MRAVVNTQGTSNTCHRRCKGTLFVHVEKARNEEGAKGSEVTDDVKVYTVANETVETRYD